MYNPYISLNDCPVCNGEINSDSFESDGEFAWRKATCVNCDFTYQELYVFMQNENLQGEQLLQTEIDQYKEENNAKV